MYIAWFSSFLGRTVKALGNFGQAAIHLTESLELFRDLGDKDGIAFALEGFAGLAVAGGAPERAAHLFGAAAALREVISSPMAPVDEPEYERDVATARAQMDEAAFRDAWAAGWAMSLEQIMAYALRDGG